MATDAYVKFGEIPGNNLPLIEGDCTDEGHYWWCELRDADFDLKAPNRTPEGEGDSKEKKATGTFENVTIKKRVDWASAQLFVKCCEAGSAKIAKSKEDQDKGRINQVTVDICRSAGGKKFPFVIIRYYGVRIVSFGIDMSGPEPSETITFEIEDLDFEYQPTKPETGLEDGPTLKALHLTNHEPDPTSSHGSTSSADDGTPAAAPAGAAAPGGGAGGATPASAAAGASGNGSPAPLVTTTDAAVGASFPGLWQGTGFGVLPD